MKKTIRLFPSALLAVSFFCIGIATAQNSRSQPKELVDLRSRFDAEVAAAVQPIQNIYISELQKLLNAATRRGDLPAANAVQAELNRFTNAFGRALPVGSPQSRLVGTSWENADGSRIEFLAGGQFREFYRKKHYAGNWKAVSAIDADVTLDVGQRYHYKYDSDTNTLSRTDTPVIWRPAK